MAFLLHPVQYAVQRCVDAVVKTPERGARVSGQTTQQDLGATPEASSSSSSTSWRTLRTPTASAPNLEHEALAFDPYVGFHPTYYYPFWQGRPHSDEQAQRLYNHARTVAWYADSMPLLSSKLPFNVGLDSIVGLIPGLGDAIGAVIGVYLVVVVAFFGLPLKMLGIMLALVVVDTLVGSVPVVGDALDVAFKVS